MSLLGNSSGKGAGCPTLLADSAEKSQMLFVNSRNSSLEIVFRPEWPFRENDPFEKIRMYSWTSRRVGFEADFQLPQAVDGPALELLFKMISPRISKPKSSRSCTRNA